MDLNELEHVKSYRDRISSVSEKGERKWVYASKPSGKFYNLRKIVVFIYVATLITLPFIKINGMPFVLINLPEGRFILFSKIFWPQDFYIFAIGMIAFIMFIALFTVIYGRLFCGWVCPQTIFMEFFYRPIEWMVEGNPAAQKLLNNAPWSGSKIAKKITKHALFLIVTVLISNIFLAYIFGIEKLWDYMKHPADHISLLIGIGVFSLFFYFVFAFVRDIVCTTICPYGRLQGTLFDKDTMQIAYDYKRGEPRGKINKKAERTIGDCIDCGHCVHVCPTGIDIRDGLQMECVGCTACIDACDDMMVKVHLPKGLIRYASENEIASGEKWHFTTKAKAYSIVLAILSIAMFVLLLTRKDLDVNVARAAGQLYNIEANSHLSNLYNLRFLNKQELSYPVKLKLENMNGTLEVVGGNTIYLKKADITNATLIIHLARKDLTGYKTKVLIGVYQGDKKIRTIKVSFIGPMM